MTLAAGAKLGPYQILDPLGAGGMGEVYRARDPRLEREVAVKVLPAELSADPERVRRFEQEARAAGALNHPNILSVYDAGSESGVVYLVTELLEGETLRARLESNGLPPRKAVECAAAIARGLAAAHRKGIVHRDLKPENVFLTSDGGVKILDFGLAKLRGPAAKTGTEVPTEALHTSPGVVVGTAGYMSPEQVRGEEVDHRSDIFSLGAVLYEMLAGRRAFQAASAVETMHAILKEDPPPMAAVQPALEQMVRHCLEKNAPERFQSAQDLAFDLASLSGISAPAPAQPSRAPSRGVVAALVGLTLLAAGFLAGWLAFRPGSPDLPAYRFTAIATDPGLEGGPAWSPDGNTLAYFAEVNGVCQIFTRSLAAATPARLTQSEQNCFDPFWSPDGSRVYFRMGRSSVAWASLDLYAISAAGGRPELILPDVMAAGIAPDGKALAFARSAGDSGFRLWVRPSPGAEPKPLDRDPLRFAGQRTCCLRFSPDGSHIGLALSRREGVQEFWLVPYPEGDPRRVLTARTFARGLSPMPFSWLADSRHVAFGARPAEGGPNHLVVADTRSGRLRQITSGTGQESEPSVAPSGGRIAFTTRSEEHDIIEVPLDGGPPRDLLATSRNEHCPEWLPGGNQFAFTKESGGSEEIWLHNRQDGTERPLVTAAVFRDGSVGRVTEPRFSPDGSRLAFARAAGEGISLWLMASAGGPPVPLVPGGGIQFIPSWSPDGQWISFVDYTTDRLRLMKAPSSGGAQPVLIREGDRRFLSRPQWSPRGDWITWMDGKGLWLVSPDGRDSRRLSPDTTWQSLGFTSGGSGVAGIRPGAGRRLLVVAIDIATLRERIISNLGPAPSNVYATHGFSLAPDGKSFAVSITRERGDIWILEGFRQP